MKTRYFNLAVDWYESDWLEPLSDSAQLAWVRLLGYAKRDGRAGAVRLLSSERLARKLEVKGGIQAVQEMMDAALAEGAIEIDHDWGLIRIVKWADYQDTRGGNVKKPARKGSAKGCAHLSGAQSTEHRALSPDTGLSALCCGDASLARPEGDRSNAVGNVSQESRKWWQSLTEPERQQHVAAYEQTDLAEQFPARRGKGWRTVAVTQMYITHRRSQG